MISFLSLHQLYKVLLWAAFDTSSGENKFDLVGKGKHSLAIPCHCSILAQMWNCHSYTTFNANTDLDLHSGWRSKDLGVMMINGFRKGRAICEQQVPFQTWDMFIKLYITHAANTKLECFQFQNGSQMCNFITVIGKSFQGTKALGSASLTTNGADKYLHSNIKAITITPAKPFYCKSTHYLCKLNSFTKCL
jgi:hypothetical protein